MVALGVGWGSTECYDGHNGKMTTTEVSQVPIKVGFCSPY